MSNLITVNKSRACEFGLRTSELNIMTIPFELINTTSPYHLNSSAQHDHQTILSREAIQDPFELRSGAWTLEKFEWILFLILSHQHPIEAMNPSNSTICAKLQAQETVPLELQTTHQKHSYNVSTSYHIAWTKYVFFVEGCWRSIYEAQTHKIL